MRSRAAALTAGAALLLLAAPRWLSVSAQEQPVFRSGVDLVTVDVSVIGPDGRPVDDLTADKFQVLVDGVPRRIVRAVYVPHRLEPASAVASSPYFSSNEYVDPGRLLLIAVDRQHIRRVEGLAALRAAAEFVDQLDPSDRVAAAPLDHVGAIQFTNNHAGVKSYLQALVGTETSFRGEFNVGLSEALAISDGQRSWLDRVVLRECGQPLSRFENMARAAEREGFRDPCPTIVEQESRAKAQEARANARTSLNQLIGLIARLAEIDGPKTLVFVSEGLVAEPQLIDLTSLGSAAQAARVTLYVLQLEQPMFDASESTVSPTLHQDLQVKGDGLARLAGTARGTLFRLVGADPHPFRRILRELTGYYLLAFEASPADLDGRTRRIEVTARTPGATVRARPAFRRAASPVAAEGDAQIVRLLRSPRLATELTVRTTAHAFREGAEGAIRVVVSAEAGDVEPDQVRFGYVLIGADGVIAASGSEAVTGGRFTHDAVVPAGRYMLKVAALDPAGRMGSIERQFDARLTAAGAVGMSDLLLTESAPGEPLRPVIARTTADRIGAVFEFYGAAGWKPNAVAADVEVKSAEGDATLVSVPASLRAVTTSTWRARAELPLQRLAPGGYVVTATIKLPDGTVKKVERGFVK
jgi:VWFA-related protein